MTTEIRLTYDTGNIITHTLTKKKNPRLELRNKFLDHSAPLYIQDHGNSGARLQLGNSGQYELAGENLNITPILLSGFPQLLKEECLQINIRSKGNISLQSKVNSEIRNISIKHLG